MIESIGVNHADIREYQEIVLTQPELSGIIVKSIDGLGPTGANINFTELATIDGAIDNSAKLETRELKIDLIFMTNSQLPLIEDVRLKTYKLFPVKKNITFYIKTDRRGLIHCYGRVEKNEPKIFQKQEGCTITIKCADPYWHTDEEVNTMFYGVEPLFEFQYDNESIGSHYQPGKYYDKAISKGFIINKTRTGYEDDCDKVHIQVFKVNDHTFTNDLGHQITYGLYEFLFDSYVSRVPSDDFYIGTSDDFKTIYENHELFVAARLTQNNTIITQAMIKQTISEGSYSKYVFRSYEMVLGSGGDVINGEETEFGNINNFTEGNVFYDGEADTGIILEIIAKGAANGCKFYDMETGEMMQVSNSIIEQITHQGIDQGDVITINTKKGQKSAKLLRNGETYDILNALIPTVIDEQGTKRMEWLELHKGDNVFGYDTPKWDPDASDIIDTGGLENLVFNVRYDMLYEGV